MWGIFGSTTSGDAADLNRRSASTTCRVIVPLQIIRDEQRIGSARGGVDPFDELAFDLGVDVRVALVVDARDLLIAVGHDAHFLDRRPAAVRHQAFCRDSPVAEQRAQRATPRRLGR